MAGAYGNRDASKENGNGNLESGGDHEHGYEWAQAREAERLERDQSGTAAPPPGYEVSSSESTPVRHQNLIADSFRPHWINHLYSSPWTTPEERRVVKHCWSWMDGYRIRM